MTNVELTAQLLEQKNMHISFAESCTGGMCAAEFVGVDGASSSFDVSFVTYANEAKTKYLGVSPKTIADYGVVSEQVADEMCRGVAKAAESQVGVGITGIAGPTGGTKSKPVGMVCFGFFVNGKVYTFTQQFGNIGRNNVRKKSKDFVFSKLVELLKNS